MSYQRTIDLDSGDSLARLARWIRPGATVLELGPATGYFTEWLQGRGCTVDVVEIDPEAARRAEPFARRVVVADLDADGWDDALGAARYDCVVCADVLEHLRHGQRLLERLRTRLAPEGELLLSVPNVAHAAIIMELLDDRFEYGGEGLLDSTHLRLYTWRSLAAVLAAAGFEVRAWDATEKTPWESEFRSRTEVLPPELRGALGPGTRHHAYQWLVRAVPGSGGLAATPPALAGGEQVPLRFLCAPRTDQLSLDRAETVFVPASGDPRDCEFRFPAGSQALRVFLADRVGVMIVDECALLAGAHEVWRLGLPGGRLVAGADAVALDEHRFALIRPDAWIEPALDAGLAPDADRLVMRLRWIGDWAGAAGWSALSALAEAEAARRDAAAARVVALEAMVEERDQAIAARDESVAARRRELAVRDAEVERLEAALAAQARLIAYRHSWTGWLRLPLQKLRLALHRRTGKD